MGNFHGITKLSINALRKGFSSDPVGIMATMSENVIPKTQPWVPCTPGPQDTTQRHLAFHSPRSSRCRPVASHQSHFRCETHQVPNDCQTCKGLLVDVICISVYTVCMYVCMYIYIYTYVCIAIERDIYMRVLNAAHTSKHHAHTC